MTPMNWSRPALEAYNTQQRIIANLHVITAITEGRTARALDVVLADGGVRLAYESARETGLVAATAAAGQVVRMRPKLRVVPPPAPGPQGGAA